jgi:general secretion pathway protein K
VRGLRNVERGLRSVRGLRRVYVGCEMLCVGCEMLSARYKAICVCKERGGALLAVLWLSAALAAIAFSVANTVRGETERTTTHSEGVRAYYLATGSVDRALLYIHWSTISGARNPDGTAKYFEPGTSILNFAFPTGFATVEIIPETAKLNINQSTPEELMRLVMNVGAEPERAREIVMGIVDWRTLSPVATSFDQYYLGQNPSFRARHASFEEIEELLLVKGMTPDLFYGSYARDAQGYLRPRGGLRDCLSVYGTTVQVDANTAEPAVLATVGLSPNAIAALIQRRHAAPFRTQAQLGQFTQTGGPGFNRLRVGGNSIFTLRSSARLRLPDGRASDLVRTVSALVKFRELGATPPYDVLRWYEN